MCGEELGAEAISIAYPYGDVDARVERAAAAAGYRTGTCLGSRLEQLGVLRWPRVGVYPADVCWRFRLKVARPMRRLRASAAWPG